MSVHVSLTHVALLLFQAGKLPFQCDRGTEAALGSTQVLLGTLQPFRAAGPHRRCGGRNVQECEQKLDAANRKGRKLTCFVGRYSSQEKHEREVPKLTSPVCKELKLSLQSCLALVAQGYLSDLRMHGFVPCLCNRIL